MPPSPEEQKELIMQFFVRLVKANIKCHSAIAVPFKMERDFFPPAAAFKVE